MSERKVCVATGSSSGIGAAVVRLYAARGWDVVINCSRDTAPAEAVAEECRALGAEAIVVKANVAEDADCRRLAEVTDERFQRADVLVNNAGTTKFVPAKHLDGLSAEDFQRIYAVNVIGPYQMSRAFADLLGRNAGSAIVNVSSVAGLLGVGSSIAYAASKGALNTLTISLARALGPAIRVNAIAPGMVESSWLEEGLGKEAFAQALAAYKARSLLESAVSPEDVAEMAWWLGAGASKTTGEVLVVDGGVRYPKF